MAQHAATRIARDGHSTEIRTVHVRNTVVLCQPFIQERIVRVEQIEHRPVVPQDALEQQFRFPLQRLTQVVVEIGKEVGVRLRGE